jgi:hypothetical protein
LDLNKINYIFRNGLGLSKVSQMELKNCIPCSGGDILPECNPTGKMLRDYMGFSTTASQTAPFRLLAFFSPTYWDRAYRFKDEVLWDEIRRKQGNVSAF